MVYCHIQPIDEFLILTSVNYFVQVVIDIGDVLLVTWLQLTSHHISMTVQFVAAWVVVEY